MQIDTFQLGFTPRTVPIYLLKNPFFVFETFTSRKIIFKSSESRFSIMMLMYRGVIASKNELFS